MSLYASINVSTAQQEEKVPVQRQPPPLPGKAAKSASLYATVLARPPSSQQQQIVEPPPPPQAAPNPDPEPENPASGTLLPVHTYLTTALQFKPTIRKIQKPVKPKSSLAAATVTIAPTTHKSFLQDVSRLQEDIANDDVNGFYRTAEGAKLARKAARKNKKRKNDRGYTWTWDDDYDPLHPNDYDTYVDSDEQLREQIEWKRKRSGKPETEDEEGEGNDGTFRGFAPPKEYGEGFGDDGGEEWKEEEPVEDEGEYVPEPVAELDVDESGEDVYARRLRMAREAGMNVRTPTPSPPPAAAEENYDGEEVVEEPPVQETVRMYRPNDVPTSLQPQPSHPAYTSTYYQPPSYYNEAPGRQPLPPPPQPPATATISSEPVHYTAAITTSSEPVHYTTSSDPVQYASATASSEPDSSEPRGSHPGQRDFATRLMSKYGWQKGQGLGADSTGLVTPLIAKASKEKKGSGQIINRNKRHEDYGEQGKMSRCVVLANVVAAGEADEELVEEIGGECREKYGEVERVRVHGSDGGEVRVFVLFTSELSALRGVNGLNGRLFGGRTYGSPFLLGGGANG